MKLGIPVYEGVNLLDVTGPLEMFYWAGQHHALQTLVVSHDGRPVTALNGIRFEPHADFAQAPRLDVLWVPGGSTDALARIMRQPDSPYLDYLRATARHATWVCSVCEGALLLARAGLLRGHRATTHWAFVECLRKFPDIDVDTTNPRFVVSGNRLTGGGISAGLDEALKLVALLFGDASAESVQVTTQYFPQPPVMGTLPAPPACPVSWGC